ncbi:MAG: TIGR02710 family CRISPR-associated CARF protein [Thermodesulfobacteriota bacterium]
MEFNEKIDQWKQLFKTKREEADQFYYSYVFEEIINRFLKKSKNLRRYRFLISLLGFSPQPVILFICAIKPEKVLFIHSEETESYLDVIQQWTGIKLAQVVKEQVNSSDPTGVYKAIKGFIDSRNPKEVLLDITGGKKAMVGGAAMAGNLLGIDTGYVDYERYLDDLRQPEPGSEYPNILKNPLYVLGDIDLEKAKEAFSHYDFRRCLEILEELDQRVEDIWGIRKLKALAEIYQAWDAFNFSKASTLLASFMNKCENDARFINLGQLRKNADVLTILSCPEHSEYRILMCLNYFFGANRCAERARYDIAVFLMYRTLEMVLSAGLKEVGIEASDPSYPGWLTVDRYNEKLQKVFEKDHYEKNLPHKVGLMDSAVILSIKGDSLVEDLNLKELKGIIELRNTSHFTHGSRVLNEEDFNKIRRLSRKLLEKYLSLKRKPSVREFEQSFSFPKI